MDCGFRISGTVPGNRRPPSAGLSDCGLGTDLWRDACCPRSILQNEPNFGEPGWDRRTNLRQTKPNLGELGYLGARRVGKPIA